MLRQLHLPHVSLRALFNRFLVELLGSWYISTALPPLQLLEYILVKILLVLVLTAALAGLIEVHLTVVVLFRDC